MLVRRRVPIKSKNLNPLRVLRSFDNIGSMAHENGGVRYDLSRPLYLCMCIYIYIFIKYNIYIYHGFQIVLNKFMVWRSVNSFLLFIYQC